MTDYTTDWIQINGPSLYKEVLNKMESIVSDIIDGKRNDSIILTEHNDIITKGTSALDSEIISSSEIEVIQTGRGGKFTYHGKGQRIIYPMINLNNEFWARDLKNYLNFLHQWIISTFKEFGLETFTRPDHIGIWTKQQGQQDAKIAAIGIRAKKWVTYHGIAVNISTDLSKYESFIPCGISDLGVTSAKTLGYDFSFKEFDEILKKSYYTTVKECKKNERV